MRWSLWDKKKMETIVQLFQKCNRKIRDNVELLIFQSQLGINPQHLHRLQTDVNSRALGYDTNASLTLLLKDDGIDNRSLELTDPAWLGYPYDHAPAEGSFSILRAGTSSYLQEIRPYSPPPFSPPIVDPRTRDRVNLLARLLEQPKGQVFRIPHCIGWKFEPLQNHITFVFEIPSNLAPQPISLLKLLCDEDAQIQLGKKFRLAHGLAECISNLHMVKWVNAPIRYS
jgi:hypothetical protein